MNGGLDGEAGMDALFQAGLKGVDLGLGDLANELLALSKTSMETGADTKETSMASGKRTRDRTESKDSKLCDAKDADTASKEKEMEAQTGEVKIFDDGARFVVSFAQCTTDVEEKIVRLYEVLEEVKQRFRIVKEVTAGQIGLENIFQILAGKNQSRRSIVLAEE